MNKLISNFTSNALELPLFDTRVIQSRLNLPKQRQSAPTQAILLLVLLCQFFATSSAFSVQYPSGEHPMGIDVNHHHSHEPGNSHEPVNGSELYPSPPHSIAAFNATEPVHLESIANENMPADAASQELDHEHANHSHTPSHLGVDLVLIPGFFQSEIVADDDISYLNCRHAPPIPPPHT